MASSPSLILRRFKGESVVITTPAGDKVEVIAHAIKDKHVSLMFKADRSIRINRKEIENNPSRRN